MHWVETETGEDEEGEIEVIEVDSEDKEEEDASSPGEKRDAVSAELTSSSVNKVQKTITLGNRMGSRLRRTLTTTV